MVPFSLQPVEEHRDNRWSRRPWQTRRLLRLWGTDPRILGRRVLVLPSSHRRDDPGEVGPLMAECPTLDKLIAAYNHAETYEAAAAALVAYDTHRMGCRTCSRTRAI